MPRSRRRFFVPEVVQTSKVDCGPAALKAVLDGFGIAATYARLREVCQTQVDGTSVDRLEQIAVDFGLDAEQVLVPIDHVLPRASGVLPGIAVVSSAAGDTHFIVAWRTHGSLVQVMDPARGRLWMPRRAFLQQLYVHSTIVLAADWREWAATEEFLAPLRERLSALGLPRRNADRHVSAATADPSWRGLAALDASVRLLATLRESRALARADVDAALTTFTPATHSESPLPDRCWSVRPAAPGDDGEERVALRGAVVLRARGARPSGAVTPARPGHGARHGAWHLSGTAVPGTVPGTVPWLAAAVGGAIALAVAGTTLEIILLRRLLDLGSSATDGARGTLIAMLLMAGAALLALEWILAAGERRLGERLEARLRAALFEKIPRLSHRYLHTRPMSDIAERCHSIHHLRLLPALGIRTLRTATEIAVTTGAIVWLAPSVAAVAIAGATAAAAIPLLGHSIVAERDLRQRTHAGALARFHMDALLGRSAIDAHHAGATIEREHEQLLAEWSRSGTALQRATTAVEGLQLAIGFGIAGWLVARGLNAGAGGTLLLVYWTLQLPALAYEFATQVREYPFHRSTLLRLLEPLDAEEAPGAAQGPVGDFHRSKAVDIDLRGVTILSTERTVLDDVRAHIPAGSHVAIVGPSGAGKSTLVSVLLGWHPDANAGVLVDGRPLDGDRIAALRRRTAWVDPTVHIWNASLLDNLLYGSTDDSGIGATLEAAELLPVITRLPGGLATSLGESGTLLSAGEAQRVRLGRVLMRDDPALVLLDEPFRGLERERRRALVARVRERWPHATLLYITHDIAEAAAFGRVLVLDRGRIVEDGDPLALAQRPASRYRRMLHAQEALHSRFGSAAEWRRVRLEDGRVIQHSHHGADLSIEQTA